MRRNFRSCRRGIVAVLAVGIVSILVTIMVWVVSMMPAAMFWDAIDPMMPHNTHGTMRMLNNVAGWMLLIEVVGICAWMGVHAFRKEVVEYPG